MKGHIITEDRFLHQGIDHHLYVAQIDGSEHEFRFEVQRTAPGSGHQETIYENTANFCSWLSRDPATNIGELICKELALIKKKVFTEEDIHANDP